jgi:hypothetical protein
MMNPLTAFDEFQQLKNRMELGGMVVRTARTYLGVPFKPYGRTREGLDCPGLLLCVASDLGWRSISRESRATNFAKLSADEAHKLVLGLGLLDPVPADEPASDQ